MRQGEIWLIKLDKTKSVGHEYHKDRPALILISDNLVNSASVVTIMPMSSSLNYGPNDILVKKNTKNRLACDSIIKVDHIMSYDKSRFIHKIGEVDRAVMDQVAKYLKKHFGL